MVLYGIIIGWLLYIFHILFWYAQYWSLEKKSTCGIT